MEENRRQLRAEFPNWPEEILEEWLLPSANRHGWPPPSGPGSVHVSWENILLNRSVSFWKKVTWSREDRPLTNDGLTPDTNAVLNTLEQHVQDQLIRGNLSDDDYVRVARALRHIASTGRIAGRLVALEVNGLLDLADGYHRVLAYFGRQKIIHANGGHPDEGTPLQGTQPMWIGKHSQDKA